MPYDIVNSNLSCGAVAVALLCKSGSTAITEAGEGWYLNNQQALNWPLRLAFIREPFDRFCSAYSFFAGRYWVANDYKLRGTEESAAKSYYHFVNFALENEDDHWMEQGKSLLFNEEYTPTHTLKFEALEKVWPNFTNRVLSNINSSVRLPVCPEYRRKELDEMFGSDIELYNAALDDFNG